MSDKIMTPITKIFDDSFKKDILTLIRKGVTDMRKAIPPGAVYSASKKPPEGARVQTTEGGAQYWIPGKKDKDSKADQAKPKRITLWDKEYGTPEQEFDQSEREYSKLKETLGSYDKVEQQDAKDIGTKDYKGVAHFWHPDNKYPMTVDMTMKQRRDVHNQYIKAGLKLDGKSEKHREIMTNVLVAGGRFTKDPKTGSVRLKRKPSEEARIAAAARAREEKAVRGAKPVKLNFDSKDKPHPNVSSPNPKHKPFSVTNDEGNTFQIRFLSSGSKWGRGNVLTHGKDKKWSYEKQGYAVPEKYAGDVIQFYSTKNTDDKSKWVLASSYNVKDMLYERGTNKPIQSEQGIKLNRDVADWNIHAKAMGKIRNHLKKNEDKFDFGEE